MPAEKVRLRIGNLGKAVLVTGQAYQDPKDALNEFVSNAADEYADAGWLGRRIRVVLSRRGRRPVVAVSDDGRGMDSQRLRELATSLFESTKAGDPRTIGEKAIGILAFQQLGGRCDIVTRPMGQPRTYALRLVRGDAVATLELDERRRPRDVAGTTVYISDLDPDVVRMLTMRKVVDYLRRRRGAALARGDYSIEVVEGTRAEMVTPERVEGLRVELPAVTTLWGRLEFALFVTSESERPRRVAIVGRGGTTIIDDICELEEFEVPPWNSNQVAGQIVFEGLAQTAGRRAIVRDREAFPVFLDAVKRIEGAVSRTVERVSRQVAGAENERLADTIRRLFERVLKELSDLDNPMRTAIGQETGHGALFASARDDGGTALTALASSRIAADEPAATTAPGDTPIPSLGPAERPTAVTGFNDRAAQADGKRSASLPTLAADPQPGSSRSRFDAETGVVLYNEMHADYLAAKQDPALLLDYLATLVAKEYVVYNNPRASSDDVAEEMVRLLVRLRRHLSGRRRRP